VNVLAGDMSLVGPRPLTPHEAAAVTPQHGARWDARPGLVSLHAIRDRARLAHAAEGDTDCEYIYRQSITSDAGLLARALPAALLPAPDRVTPDTLVFFGVRVANITMEDAVAWIIEQAADRRQTSIAFVNPDCLNISYTDRAYQRALQSFTRVLPDGVGLNLACQMMGTSLKANVNGTDLFPHLCDAARAAGLSLFLLGGKPGIAAAAAATMVARYPGLTIAGTHDGFFTAEDEPSVIATINASGASILLAGFGAPRQELWLARHAAALEPPVRLGVGGLFDYFSGRIPRAPAWMRESGLEWMWRLGQEPSRLWRRYLIGGPIFLARVWRDTRRQPQPDDAWRDALLQRFNTNGPLTYWRRQQWRIKCQMWTAVVAAALGLKRLIDIVGGLLLLITLSPVLILVAAAVRADSKGPVFFRQTRVGRWGRTFPMIKFRSMHVDAEARKAALSAANEMAGGVTFKMKNDPRITRVGRFIRKASIDELPQLWNVIVGQMSLVGPRPPVPSEVARYSPEERRRLDGVPGITCLWQVSGRSTIPFPEQVRLDVRYLESQSIWLDLQLLIKTIPAVLFGRGAY
jgi:exopolysaccharide biosynthesis WecB/TagA/CpsF family protein